MGWVSCKLVGYLCTCTIIWLSVCDACPIAWTVALSLGASDILLVCWFFMWVCQQGLCDMVYELCV